MTQCFLGQQIALLRFAGRVTDHTEMCIRDRPGGCGTLEELLEIITWKQLGLYLNPIIILNINGFYNPLLEICLLYTSHS